MHSETCAQRVLAEAYVARHGLVWSKRPMVTSIPSFHVVIPGGQGPGKPVGVGYTLYEAVLDFQENSGISWGA
jgi:hypothetical protein